jgi:hypothetical protein
MLLLVVILALSLVLMVERIKRERLEQLALMNEKAARQVLWQAQQTQAQFRRALDEAKSSVPRTTRNSPVGTSVEADP